MNAALHVVAAVIRRADGAILLALRPRHLHQGGLWEFPGGKVAPGEAPRAALRRELEEELGIIATTASPLIQILHRYPEREVFLDVFEVCNWRGEPHGREGQPITWVAPSDLDRHEFPAANLPIVRAAQLPRALLVTPEPASREDFLAGLESCLERGIAMVLLRAKTLSPEAYVELAAAARERCSRHHARLILNAPAELVAAVGADGVHLTAAALRQTRARPIGAGHWLSAACHNAAELEHARRIGADFALLSPVAATPTHPAQAPLGWTTVRDWVRAAALPVYALGGMTRGDLEAATTAGCHGIATIRGVWSGGDWREATLGAELQRPLD